MLCGARILYSCSMPSTRFAYKGDNEMHVSHTRGYQLRERVGITATFRNSIWNAPNLYPCRGPSACFLSSKILSLTLRSCLFHVQRSRYMIRVVSYISYSTSCLQSRLPLWHPFSPKVYMPTGAVFLLQSIAVWRCEWKAMP